MGNALSRSGIEKREEAPMKTPFLIGRLVFGGFFLYSGINHFMQRKTMAQYAGAKGVPAPELAVQATGAALAAIGPPAATVRAPHAGAHPPAGG